MKNQRSAVEKMWSSQPWDATVFSRQLQITNVLASGLCHGAKFTLAHVEIQRGTLISLGWCRHRHIRCKISCVHLLQTCFRTHKFACIVLCLPKDVSVNCACTSSVAYEYRETFYLVRSKELSVVPSYNLLTLNCSQSLLRQGLSFIEPREVCDGIHLGNVRHLWKLCWQVELFSGRLYCRDVLYALRVVLKMSWRPYRYLFA